MTKQLMSRVEITNRFTGKTRVQVVDAARAFELLNDARRRANVSRARILPEIV